MIANYFRIAVRQLLRNGSINAVNLLGLAFGLACCAICFLNIKYEYSYDDFHEKGPRLYRLVTGNPATTDSWVKMAAPTSPKLKGDVPEIEDFVRFNSVSWNDKVAVEYEDRVFLESHFMMADPSFLTSFSFPLLTGDPRTALSQINNVVITESTARKLFGEAEPIGQTIRLRDNQLDFQVSGVLVDLPENTHLKCDYLISFENLERVMGQGRREAWGELNYFTYLVLRPDAEREVVQQKIQAISVEMPNNENLTFEGFRLQPIRDIHFQHSRGNISPSYDKRYIYIFFTLAFTVLVIATMNYFNLSTMLSLKRVREIGVRKSIGATSEQLTRQFISENMAMVVLSLILAIGLILLGMPVISAVLSRPLTFDLGDPWFVAFLIGLCVPLGVGSGSYLAFYVNRFRPGAILKGLAGKGNRSNGIQHTLIGIQFALSLILICSSLVITRQMSLVTHKDLGFDHAQVITVSLSRDITPSQVMALEKELVRSPVVEAAGASDFTPGRANWHQTAWWQGQTIPDYMFVMTVDQQFMETLKMEMVEGNSEALQSSAEVQYVINESARDLVGWETALGKLVSPFGQSRALPVSAVVKDFNYTSLHFKVEPLIIAVYKERKFSKLFVRLTAGDVQESIGEVERIFKFVTGGNQPFEFVFMDDSIDRLYQAELRLSKVVTALTVIAVVFALLGIYTLISVSIESRTKEIAIRKVLGISAINLISLFTRKYFKLALGAALIAIPLCWSMLGSWLANFTYRIELSPLWFVLAVAVVLVSITIIALIKYTSMNSVSPAQSLKYE
jgi:putative ABC transport system permease protein